MEKQTLDAVRDFAEDRFKKRMLFEGNGLDAFVLHFLPGQALPAHRHPGAELVALVWEGSGIFTVDGTETEAAAGDVVRCGGEEWFSFRNTGDGPCRLFVVLVKPAGAV